LDEDEHRIKNRYKLFLSTASKIKNFTADNEKILLDLAANQLKWQLCYLVSRTSFSNTIALYRKTAVLLKLSKANFSGFFISTAKI